jgi:hypothetical protein
LVDSVTRDRRYGAPPRSASRAASREKRAAAARDALLSSRAGEGRRHLFQEARVMAKGQVNKGKSNKPKLTVKEKMAKKAAKKAAKASGG